jgi:hypothetical protein
MPILAVFSRGLDQRRCRMIARRKEERFKCTSALYPMPVLAILSKGLDQTS